MKRYLILLLLTVMFSVADMNTSYCHADSLCDYYIKLAHQALDNKQYKVAYYYFDTAHAVDPKSKEPLYYLNLIKRLQDNRVKEIEYSLDEPAKSPRRKQYEMKPIKVVAAKIVSGKKEKRPSSLSVDKVFEKNKNKKDKRKKLKDSEKIIIKADVQQMKKQPIRIPKKKDKPHKFDNKIEGKIKKEKVLISNDKVKSFEQDVIRTIQKKEFVADKKIINKVYTKSRVEKKIRLQSKIELDDEFWHMQPKTQIEIELDKFILLEGKDIKRFLVLNQDIFQVERIDNDILKIIPLRIGSSICHVWDERGRWTFTIRSIIPLKFNVAAREQKEKEKEGYVDPFRFSYSNNWGSSYSGDSFPTLKRTSLKYRQDMSLNGPTPYGDFYSFIGFTTFGDSTDLVRQGVGLYDGKIGPFKDFTIKGWDITESFSSLSLPGRSLRGVSFKSYAFDKKIQYSFFRGNDRARFEIISPGVSNIKKSYLQGTRVTYFHDKDNEYSMNYIKGWGEERPGTLKDKVMSLEAKNKIKGIQLHSEIGYDEDSTAKLIRAFYSKDNYSWKLNVRDIEKDYKTISSNPSGSGEVGGEMRFSWHKDKTRVNSVAEVYRDREYFNEDKKNGVNFNFSTTLYHPLTDSIIWNSSLYYVDTPQLMSPHRNVRFNNRISKSFRFFKEHPFSIFIGNAYARSRYDKAASSDYDRYALKGGFNIKVIKNLNYYLNYTYSWVNDVSASTTETPRVMNTGFNYSKRITKKMSGNLNFSYRNEENTEGNFSFLSGSDSLRGSLGLSYRPKRDVEIFIDASGRNIWSESADQDAYNEAEVRIGLTSSFDTLFRWNPSCIVSGVVYRDLNADKKRDDNEPGLQGIKVNVGKKKVLTDKNGEYRAKVRAKKAKISVNPESLPAGFVFSTESIKDIKVVQGTEEIVNFGVTTHSGIYGVVYLDKNLNRRLDADDYFVPSVRIIMDNKTSAYSNTDGAYSFSNISQGRHTISIDINSLSLEYIPLVKVKSEIVVAEGTTYTFNIPLKVK